MATLLELADYSKTPEYNILLRKILTAISIKAVAIGNLATPTTEQVTFAKNSLTNVNSTANIIINYVLAANSTATLVLRILI